MPELPEVETVRRGLTPVLEGARLSRVRINRPDLRFPFPDHFADRLAGYRTSKGAIRFQPEKPLPPDLVADIVARRIEQDEAAATARAARKKRPGSRGRHAPRP